MRGLHYSTNSSVLTRHKGTLLSRRWLCSLCWRPLWPDRTLLTLRTSELHKCWLANRRVTLLTSPAWFQIPYLLPPNKFSDFGVKGQKLQPWVWAKWRLERPINQSNKRVEGGGREGGRPGQARQARLAPGGVLHNCLPSGPVRGEATNNTNS